MISDLTPLPPTAPKPKTPARIRHYAAQKAMRAEQRDHGVSHCGLDKRARIDLGLAVFGCYALPGQAYARWEIAFWCGCTEVRIGQIEQRAIRKLKTRLATEPLLRELAEQCFALPAR